MREIDKELYKDCMTLFNKWTTRMQELESSSITDSLNTGYTIRESVEYINEIKKSLEKFSSKIQAALCLTLLEQGTKSAKTEYTTGVVNVKMSATPPKLSSNPEEYTCLMKHLNIPEEVYSRELVRIHYPAFEKNCTDLAGEGRTPPGISTKGMRGLPKINFRKKKGVLE